MKAGDRRSLGQVRGQSCGLLVKASTAVGDKVSLSLVRPSICPGARWLPNGKYLTWSNDTSPAEQEVFS